jgi:autoinducer 2-degrading protein
MYAILNIIRVHPEHLAEFVDNVRRHAQNSLREAGCLRFDVLQDPQDPLTICLYEVFRSEADLDTHREQDYYKRWMAMSRGWRDPLAGSRRVLNHIHPPDEAWPPAR